MQSVPNELIDWLKNTAILWGIYTGQYVNR
jgi:hypothetical protein